MLAWLGVDQQLDGVVCWKWDRWERGTWRYRSRLLHAGSPPTPGLLLEQLSGIPACGTPDAGDMAQQAECVILSVLSVNTASPSGPISTLWVQKSSGSRRSAAELAREGQRIFSWNSSSERLAFSRELRRTLKDWLMTADRPGNRKALERGARLDSRNTEGSRRKRGFLLQRLSCSTSSASQPTRRSCCARSDRFKAPVKHRFIKWAGADRSAPRQAAPSWTRKLQQVLDVGRHDLILASGSSPRSSGLSESCV